MELGSDVHTVLENYLIGNQIDYETEAGRIASAGLPYLPQHIKKTNIEKQILFSENNHIFNGYVDFLQQLDNSTWIIGDHKTCSTLSSALSPEDLKKNTQANIYAQWCFKEKDAEVVKLKWIYYRTKSTPQAKLVEIDITKNEASENFKPILKTGDEIKKIVESKAKSKDVERNESACFKYGRCPYYVKCKFGVRTTTSFTKTTEEASTISLNNQSYLSTQSFHLFVDCAPTKSSGDYKQMIELSDLLKPVLTKIKEEKELNHYRLATYGQHVGLIANYLSEYLKNNSFDNQTAILSSLKTPEGCDTLQTLTAAASKVVRGF